MKSLKIITLTAVVLPLSVCLAASVAKILPIAVTITKVSTQDVPNDISALGSLTATQSVTLSAEVSGRIQSINFKSGQQVANGMPVIQLDDAGDQAAYQSDLAALNLSRHKYQRAKLLVNTAISTQDLEGLKATVAANEATVQGAQTALDQKQIKAPFSGTLGTFQVQVGDYVSAGQALVSLVNLDQLQVNYSVPQQAAGLLKVGQLVKVTVDNYPNKTFYGSVNYISPKVNAASRMIDVQALLPNKKNLLSPGMFVHVAQQVSVSKNTLVIPQQATLADIKGYYVYRVDGNKVAKDYISLGNHVGNMVAVTTGLKNGDSIVMAGQQKLSDGSLVDVLNPSTNKSAS